ncbi:MAG: LytTR family DNA-binding domain-containing protein [Anaerovoracaceae bacterium]|jgi:DNA-binding LytR/AlgR family response regulator
MAERNERERKSLILCVGEDYTQYLKEADITADIIHTNSIEEAADLLGRSDPLWIVTRDGLERIERSQLLYAETCNRHLRIVTRKKNIEGITMGIGRFIDEVNRPFFFRCHKSFAVNVNNISSITKLTYRLWSVGFENSSETCLLSTTYYHTLMEKVEKKFTSL